MSSVPFYLQPNSVETQSTDAQTWGLPAAPDYSPVGVNTTLAADQAQPKVSTLDSWYSGVQNGLSSAVDVVETGAGSAYNAAQSGLQSVESTIASESDAALTGIVSGTKAVYNGTVSAAKSVVGDATDIVAAPVKTMLIYASVAVLVVGFAIYMAGKGGGLKVAAVV